MDSNKTWFSQRNQRGEGQAREAARHAPVKLATPRSSSWSPPGKTERKGSEDKLPFTHSEGGGLVLAHTTDLRRPFLCQPCPALQLLSASEIPRERRIIVGLSPLNLSREAEETE